MKVVLVKELEEYANYKALEEFTITKTCDYPNPKPRENPNNLIKLRIHKWEAFTLSRFEHQFNTELSIEEGYDDELFRQLQREYCAGCYVTVNCPVGQRNFKTCTHKTSNLLSLEGKHILTWSEEAYMTQEEN